MSLCIMIQAKANRKQSPRFFIIIIIIIIFYVEEPEIQDSYNRTAKPYYDVRYEGLRHLRQESKLIYGQDYPQHPSAPCS